MTSGLEKIEDMTVNLTDEASSIRDIVVLLNWMIRNFYIMSNVEKTVEEFHELDDSHWDQLKNSIGSHFQSNLSWKPIGAGDVSKRLYIP